MPPDNQPTTNSPDATGRTGGVLTKFQERQIENELIATANAEAAARATQGARVEVFPDEEEETEPQRQGPGLNRQLGQAATQAAGKQVGKQVAKQVAEKTALKTAIAAIPGIGEVAIAAFGLDALASKLKKNWPYILGGIFLLIFGIVVLFLTLLGFAGSGGAAAGSTPVQAVDTTSNTDLTGLAATLSGGKVTAAKAKQLLSTTATLRNQLAGNTAALTLLDDIDTAAKAIIASPDENTINKQSDIINTKLDALFPLLPKALRILAIAQSLIGTPNSNYYSPDPVNACASFVSTVLKKAKVFPNSCPIIRRAPELPKELLSTGATQVVADNTLLTEAVKNQLKPGDIVLFNNNPTHFEHSSIYVGNGFVVAASARSVPPHVAKQDLIASFARGNLNHIGAYRYGN